MYRRFLRHEQCHARLVVYLRRPKFDHRKPIIWKRWTTWTKPHRYGLTVGVLYTAAITVLWGNAPPRYFA